MKSPDRLSEPVSAEELLDYSRLLIRMFATERSQHWGQPVPSSLGKPVWCCGPDDDWLLEITTATDYTEYAWCDMATHRGYEYKLYLFIRHQVVTMAATVLRSEIDRWRWEVLLCDFETGQTGFAMLANREMKRGPAQRIQSIRQNLAVGTPVSRRDFALSFCIVLPPAMSTKACAIVGA